MPWRVLGAGTLCGVVSGPAEALTARHVNRLAWSRNQVACRLHAVLCDLIPGGHQKEISAAQAARILEQASSSGQHGTVSSSLLAML
jgi:hypothetical protein